MSEDLKSCKKCGDPIDEVTGHCEICQGDYFDFEDEDDEMDVPYEPNEDEDEGWIQ